MSRVRRVYIFLGISKEVREPFTNNIEIIVVFTKMTEFVILIS